MSADLNGTAGPGLAWRTHFHADTEGEREGDDDEEPRDDGEHPAAAAEPVRTRVVRCNEKHETSRVRTRVNREV